MAQKRYTPEQIVMKLREAERPGAGFDGAGGVQAAADQRCDAASVAHQLSPARRRAAAVHVQRRYQVSERRACKIVGQHRSTQRYYPRRADEDAALAGELRRLSRAHPAWGYKRAYTLRATPTRRRVDMKALGAAENSIWNLPATRPITGPRGDRFLKAGTLLLRSVEYCRGVLERIRRMDKVLLVGDVFVIVGVLVQSSAVLTVGLALVVAGFVRVVLSRRRR